MRPNQQNRRMRGRGNNNNNNNNNRKGPNPLTRSYESNGPDVKIRGSAQQIADKYTTLARDAHSSGDRVMAENYLQHAEHYNRLIAAAMAASGQTQVRDMRDDEEDGDDERDDLDMRDDNDNRWRDQPDAGSGPQPVIEGLPAEVAMSEDNRGEQRVGENRPNQPRDGNGDENFRRNRRNRRNRNGAPQRDQNGEAVAGSEDGAPAEMAQTGEATPISDNDVETSFEPA